MKIRLFVINLFCVIFVSCGGDKNTTEVTETENTKQKLIITAKAIENLDYTDYALSPEGEQALVDWEKYQELIIQINYLKKTDLSFFNGDKDVFKKFITEFKATIPQECRTNPIISRAVILETTLLKLNENLTLRGIDERTKLLNIKEVLIALSHLNYQINKKLERDIYDKIQPE